MVPAACCGPYRLDELMARRAVSRRHASLYFSAPEHKAKLPLWRLKL